MIIDAIINELIKKRKKVICNSSSYIEPKFQIFISYDVYNKMMREISDNQSLSMYFNECYDSYYKDEIYGFPVYKVQPKGSFTWTIHMVE